MSQYKQFWTFIKKSHMGFLNMDATRERLLGAINRRNQKRRKSVVSSDLETLAKYREVLELIGLGSSQIAGEVQSQLSAVAAQVAYSSFDDMMPSPDQQQDMLDSITAVGIALKNMDALSDTIIRAESADAAVTALADRFDLTRNQALILVSLSGNDDSAAGNISPFVKEMKDVFNLVLRELKPNPKERDRAHKLTLEAIEKLEQYLQLNADPDAASVLASFHYQAACDFNKAGSPDIALGHYQKSCDFTCMSYEISMAPKTLHQLDMSYFFLAEQYDRLGQKEEALAFYSTSLCILQYLQSSNTYQDSVSDDMQVVEDRIRELGGHVSRDDESW